MAKDKKKKKGSGFVYKATSADRLKRQAEQTGSRFDGIFKNGVEVFKFKNGDSTFRILPPTWDNAEYYGLEVFVHSYVGANNGTYLCPAHMKKQKCPICDAAKDARDAGDKEEAAQLSAKQRYLFWAIDRDDEGTGPKIIDMSWSMDQAIAALCTHKRSGKIIAIDHPDEGRDITIQKRGQGLNTKYFGHRIDSDPSPISDDEDVQDQILEQIRETPITAVLQYYSTDHLEAIISGAEPEDDESEDEDDEEEEKTSKKKKAGKAEKKADKKKRRSDDDDDDDEDPPFDEEDDEEDEDEDERPAKKKSAKKSAKKSSRDDDDEDEDDDDEDDRPKKKSAKKSSSKKSSRDDDDDDDEDDEDDDDEDARPKKKSSKRRDDDDDDEVEDEEEDEDERPKKKSKKSSRDDDDDDDEDEEEDERPAKKSAAKASSSSGGKSARAKRFGR